MNQLKLIDSQELREILSIGRTAFWEAKRRGNLPPAIYIGRSLRWHPDTVTQWLKENEKQTAASYQ